ncbi:hypothetical protein [Bacillus sp. PS06]|uniref:hypothetical protein n=1 Tax=Bacillus sp. PS06 TaxID=2764176 RepID=UPI001782784B|nr:hypothetical protein [Bacillus sp. PS06]MBD8070881.1 hypothetical protein [Bacillus sp. PS06]
MKKHLIKLTIASLTLITLIGCTKGVPTKFDLNQLTRVDVQITAENSNNEIIIFEEEQINMVREIFAGIKWEENVESEMDRAEDMKATLFFRYDKNMPERLLEYFIWFNQENETSIIIDREKNSLGSLDKENTQKLKKILLNN